MINSKLNNFQYMRPPSPGKSTFTAQQRKYFEHILKKNAYFLALKDEIRRAGFPETPIKKKRVDKLFRYIGRVAPTPGHALLLN